MFSNLITTYSISCSVDVDYTPDGQMTTFDTGQPVHTKMTVNFLEDRILTKTDIEAGA